MTADAPATRLLTAGAMIGLLTAGAAWATQTAAGNPPDFSSNGIAWIATSQDYISVPGGPSPTTNDPKYPYVPNGRGAQATYRVADLSNPNLKDWAKAEMKKINDDVLAGKIAYTPRSSCMPGGVPDFMAFIVEPVYFIQSPKEVLMVYAGNQEVRHVYMDVPHAKNPKPSWYGDAVGHYEGDMLVIDTVGMNAKTYVDNYRTPHTAKLHVVEHWKLIDGGKTLEVNFTADDPDTFNRPWSAIQRYRQVRQGPLDEQVCAENNTALVDYHIPQAEKPDF